eukprot:CAMPEP_0117067262 /NCGR_PEP_ID=MMETSP0472-20121206/47058_1 /TAXON_ID=693140 ORGANISM="Tiarina fusus, Strain LIS" /NCGR_SAMPLE_ID=MMETSP0472 /ASSEMBLY_ACC=CAM_ASM_000603 /LENGTH=45 /DNA_ID= /DNA_START= /DNA_END= /DNA_ORIENTATION=
MRERDIAISIKTYTLLIKAYAKRGDVVSSRKTFEEMKEEGIQPDA